MGKRKGEKMYPERVLRDGRDDHDLACYGLVAVDCVLELWIVSHRGIRREVMVGTRWSWWRPYRDRDCGDGDGDHADETEADDDDGLPGPLVLVPDATDLEKGPLSQQTGIWPKTRQTFLQENGE